MLSPKQHPGKQSLNTLLKYGGEKNAKLTGEQKTQLGEHTYKKTSRDTYLSKLQAEANLKRTLINAKYNCWNNFANSLSRETCEPIIYKLISKICGKKHAPTRFSVN